MLRRYQPRYNRTTNKTTTTASRIQVRDPLVEVLASASSRFNACSAAVGAGLGLGERRQNNRGRVEESSRSFFTGRAGISGAGVATAGFSATGPSCGRRAGSVRGLLPLFAARMMLRKRKDVAKSYPNDGSITP